MVPDSDLKSILDNDMQKFANILNATNSNIATAGTDYSKMYYYASQAKSQLQDLLSAIEALSVTEGSNGAIVKQDVENAIQTEILVQSIYEDAMKDSMDNDLSASNQKLQEAIDLRKIYEFDYVDRYNSDKNKL
ncbi:MAG: hypothetical protein K6T81_13365 [Alicyclobacillus macrosporangiidus]|uniref:hypothetical protein n=1 Tax=Alicyclobacillus macrosporangiidus TaxID=392015 RepID=UPI0026F2B4F1|nr:hypothetical protein [Alicyclobacillus macrosporangiidus]MCL6599710.1 hypothetical protein [Alicyclobacillus macrosporangiidus]